MQLGIIKNPKIIKRYNFKIIDHNDITWNFKNFKPYGIEDTMFNVGCGVDSFVGNINWVSFGFPTLHCTEKKQWNRTLQPNM